MRGDILLFHKQPYSFTDWVISFFTAGPWVHVEVDLGDGTAIGAMPKGVNQHPVNYSSTVNIAIRAFGAKDEDIEAGIGWLKERLGAKYSWADLLNSVPLLEHVGVIFGRRDGFDCSNLVARYIDKLDCELKLDTLDDNPDAVSPNDIARAAGIPT